MVRGYRQIQSVVRKKVVMVMIAELKGDMLVCHTSRDVVTFPFNKSFSEFYISRSWLG